MKKFKIAHVDPLGQGVSKIDEKVCFIRKTLPGESGTCEVLKSKSKVEFAVINKIEEYSDKRINPQCSHFNECPGCDYLHTSYEQEIIFKENSLSKTFQKLETPTIELFQAPQRLSYRNRMQLHYKKKKIGLKDSLRDEIIEIPKCKLFLGELQESFNELYKKRDFPSKKGHVEVFKNNKGEIKTTFNKPYSDGGFEQVYPKMNDVLIQNITQLYEEIAQDIPDQNVLDLFGGSGNLSARMKHDTYVIDSFENTVSQDHQTFKQIDLYKSDPENPGSGPVGLFLIDPPRSGFKNINEWSEQLKPKFIIYVSCFAATMARDLQTIMETYEMNKLQLIDLFPSTAHFETVVLLKRR